MAETEQKQVDQSLSPSSRSGGLKVWHLTLLVAFVAIAIVDIQDHRMTDPHLIALAAGGFAVYAILAWLGWRFARRYEGKIGRIMLLGLYFSSMAGLFLIATILFLLIEHVARGGRF